MDGWLWTFDKKIMKNIILLLTILTGVCPLSAEQDKSFEKSNEAQEADASEFTAATEKSKKDLIIAISGDGELSVGDNKLSKDALKQKLQKSIADKKDLKVVVRASTKTTHQKVVEVLDICKKAGVINVSFATQK